ncbi:MAG: ATP synthase F0 subunit B [Myxococcales bacterium]|nr:MAG: ATP synthase F0 subunit B [Myxococcales bacterium]
MTSRARICSFSGLVVIVALYAPTVCFADEYREGAPAAGTEHSDEASHAEHENHGISAVFSSLEFWAMLINFVLLLLILTKIGAKPMNAMLSERKAQIASGLNEAAKIKAEAEATQKEYADRLAKLDQEIEKLRAEMTKAGEAERDRLVSAAEEKAARMRRETEFLIEQRMKQIKIDLSREAIETALKSAEEVLKRELSDSDQNRLAEQF